MSNLNIDMKDLTTAIDWSNRQIEVHKQNRLDTIKEFVGNHYTDKGADKRVPTNFIELATTIYSQQLAANAPRVMISTPHASLKPFARNMELALNQVPDEIDLGDTLHKMVVEALFSVGIVKVGLYSTGKNVLGYDYGEPFVDLITIDDYFCDMSAKSRKFLQFEGNDYWLPADNVKRLYSEAAQLESDPHTVSGENGEERAESVGSDEGADLYREKIHLRDVWLPDSRQMVTYAVKSKKVLRVVDWDGPEHGPYYMLGFNDVPGNLLPLPPVALWRDLHELGNTLFRKLGRQADSKKTVAAFPGGDDEAVENLRKARDGEGVRFPPGHKPEAITVGGIDAPTLAFYLQIRDLFGYFAGNIDALGGLSPQTDTVGQEKLLSDAATARLNHMRTQTLKVTGRIVKALAWYEWTDPIRKRDIEKRLEGTDFSIHRTWSMETQEGDFLDYNIKIDPYSMQEDTPSLRLQKLGEALERFVFPALPMIQEQGGQIDMKSLTATVSRLGNIPELKDIVTFQGGRKGMSQPQGNPSPVSKPANTKRTYERVNRPGATRSGKDDVMSRLLMGGNVQGAEGASLGRTVS